MRKHLAKPLLSLFLPMLATVLLLTALDTIQAAPSNRPRPVPGNPVTYPVSNTHTAPSTSSVAIVYDETINPTSVSTRTFAVYAMQTGLVTQTYSVTGGIIRLTPLQRFKQGELVQVSATTSTLNLAGQGPISPTVWQFRVQAAGGYAYFADSGQTFPLSDTTAVALGDLDSDGDLDALVANWIAEANQIWLNEGRGIFTHTDQSLGTFGSLAAALGDLDSDGDLDAIIGNVERGLADEIWFNDGGGVFTTSNQSLGDGAKASIALGDVDGDGDLDVFVGSFYSDEVWLNDGSGFFTNTNQSLGNSETFGVALADLDGDADLDAFAAKGRTSPGGGRPNQVWLNDGAGAFTNPYPGLGLSSSAAAALGDVDGDGDVDAFVATGDTYGGGPNEVWLNDGSGVFTDSQQRLGNGDSWGVELGDLDGDGDLDAFVANAGPYNGDGEANRVWLNDGSGLFTESSQRLGHFGSFAICLGDLDSDGDLDAFVGNASPAPLGIRAEERNKVWLNQEPLELYLPIILRTWTTTN